MRPVTDQFPPLDPDPVPHSANPRRARRERAIARVEPYLALVALAALVFIMLIASGQDPGWARTGLVVCWLILAFEYLGRLLLATHRWEFVRHHPLDLLAVVIPFLRIFLFARIMPILGNRARGRLANRAALAAAFLAVLVVSLGSVVMLWAEEGRPGSNIETLGESLWWAFVTVFTVGYGDFTPVTSAGRVIGVIMMFVGVGVIAIFTASVATRFLSARDSRQGIPGRVMEEEATLDVVLARLESLEARLVAGGVIPAQGPAAEAGDAPSDETRRSE
jgi:voltage-gated potassium channel